MVLLVGPCFFADSPCNYLWSALRGEDLCLVGQAGAWGVEAWVLKKSPIFILNNFLSFNLKNGTWFPPSSFCGELDSLATASGDAYKTSVQRFSTFCKVLNFTLVSWTLNNWKKTWIGREGCLKPCHPSSSFNRRLSFRKWYISNQDQDGKICPKLHWSNFVSLCKKEGHKIWHLVNFDIWAALVFACLVLFQRSHGVGKIFSDEETSSRP